MTIPVLPPAYDAADLEIASRCIYHFRGDDQSLMPLTGQVPAFSRAATASIVDSLGTAFSAARHQPAFEPRDWDNDTVREQMGLVMGISDRLDYPADWTPKAFAWWHEFIQVGSMPSAGVALWSITNNAVSGARVVIDSSGTYWRATHHNGSTSQVITLGVAPASGNRVIQWGQVYADGSIQMWQSINEGAAINTARSSALTLAASWGSGTARLRIGASGTGNYGSQWIKRLRLAPGLPDLQTLSRIF